jgi:hypothetical protein
VVPFLLAFPQNLYMHFFLPHACYMLCHLILLDMIIQFLRGDEYML